MGSIVRQTSLCTSLEREVTDVSNIAIFKSCENNDSDESVMEKESEVEVKVTL
jgi:hypothetical protein